MVGAQKVFVEWMKAVSLRVLRRGGACFLALAPGRFVTLGRLLIPLYFCPNLWNWHNGSNCTSEGGDREGPRWAGEITALQPIGATQRQLVVGKTLNPRRKVWRGELAFVEELWSWHACAHSAMIVEHFLHDRNAAESCASGSFSFDSGSYSRGGEKDLLLLGD